MSPVSDTVSSTVFVTDAERRIRLPQNHLLPFQVAAARMNVAYLQARHAYARLVAKTEIFQPDWIIESGFLTTLDRRLLLRPVAETSIKARIQKCECCGCPGRIEFLNSSNNEYLQICPPSSITPFKWATIVEELASEPSGNVTPFASQIPFPRAPSEVTDVANNPNELLTVLELLECANASVDVTLATPEAISRRIVRLDCVELADGVLGAFSENASFQLGMSALREIRVDRQDPDLPIIYCVGPDHSLLLTIEPTADPYSKTHFNQALKSLTVMS